MSINPIVFFDLIASLFIISIALVILAFSYSQLLKKLSASQKTYEELTSSANQKDTDLLENARKKASEIIEESTQKAQEIINDSQIFNTDTKKKLDDALQTLIKHQIAYFEKTSEDFLNEYKKELQVIKNTTLQIATTASKDIEEDTKKEVQDFDSILARETFAEQKVVEEKIEDEYSKAQKQVETYKADMIKKVDDGIFKILEGVSKTALGKTIPLNEHEELIIDALEKAKKTSMN